MGIVFRQSFKNTLVVLFSFVVGGLNTLFFYPRFLGSKFYGIVTFLLSSTNLIMPLTAFGVQYTIVKFFSEYKTKQQKDRFLTIALFLPLLIALPIGFFWDWFHHYIVTRLSEKNAEVQNYTTVIYIISVCCAYFEIFYSWAKVQLKTVFGNILKEFWNRASVMLLCFAVFFGWITKSDFIYTLTGFYILRTLVMMVYAFKIYFPNLELKLPDNFNEVLKYSVYIILAGSAGAIILDIDKVMIGSKETIEKAAYYTVAAFLGSFIEAPGRAMAQILQPLTSKSINENNAKEVENLYKKSSINLLVLGGLFFLLVNCGVTELFKMMPDKGYAGGELVVFFISAYKLYTMFLGNNISIIQNSKFYKIALPIGVGSALLVYALNRYFYFQLDFGTNGLALSTFLTVVIFNTYKLWFVKDKFGITPFTNKTLKMVLIIIVLFLLFYFWNFNTPKIFIGNLPIYPMVNVILKSFLITILYLFLVVKLGVSTEINNIVKRFIRI